jgi:predicted DNA binding CopG/RHH family protein
MKKKSKIIAPKKKAVVRTKKVLGKKVVKKVVAKKPVVVKKSVTSSNVKKSITIRISGSDIQAMKVKAAKMGVPYQTYINILIHRDAVGE